MAEVDPDQEAALRRLRAAFGFVEVLKVINHEQAQDEAVQGPEGDEQPLLPMAGSRQSAGGSLSGR